MEIVITFIVVAWIGLRIRNFNNQFYIDYEEEEEDVFKPYAPSVPKKRRKKGRNALLNPPENFRSGKRNFSNSNNFNRPMDILSDDEIMPPPRDIDGLNGEE